MYRSGCEGQDTRLYTNLLIVMTHVYSLYNAQTLSGRLLGLLRLISWHGLIRGHRSITMSNLLEKHIPWSFITFDMGAACMC